MTIIESRITYIDECSDMRPTKAAPDEELASRMQNKDAHGAWNWIIDVFLVEWGKNPESVADDGIVPPSREVIGKACELASRPRDALVPPPLRVVPDGEGGVAFECRTPSCFQSLYVRHDNTVELLTFDSDCKLVDHAVIPVR